MEVNGITLNNHTPSTIPAQQVYCWTKFYTGEHRDDYRYGAIKPPTPAIGWFPAAISPGMILVAGTETFSTPEAAVEWLRAAG